MQKLLRLMVYGVWIWFKGGLAMGVLKTYLRRMRLSPLLFFLLTIGILFGLYDSFETLSYGSSFYFRSVFFDVLGVGSGHLNRLFMLTNLFAISIFSTFTIHQDIKNGFFDRYLSIYGYIKTFIGMSGILFIISFILTIVPCIAAEGMTFCQNPLIWTPYYSELFKASDPTFFLISWQLYHPIGYMVIRILCMGIWGGLFSLFVTGCYFLLKNAYLSAVLTPLSILIVDIFSDVIFIKPFVIEGLYRFKYPLLSIFLCGSIFIGCWIFGMWRKRQDVF